MNVNFNGFNESVATFIADTNLTQTGVPVKVTGDGKVSMCAVNEPFCGICVGLRGGYAAVQLSGYVTVNTIAKVATGYKKLAAGSSGKIIVSDVGREYLVINSTATEAGIIL